jgi:hypothetical protein
LLSIGAWTSSDVKKSYIATKLVTRAVEEYKFNEDYYDDFIAFNFKNGIKSDKTWKQVSFNDPPPEESAKIRKLYKKFEKYSYSQIFQKLGITQTPRNMYSPLEAKWAFAYFKKYNTWEYKPENTVSSDEILTKLDNSQAAEYNTLF